MLRILTFILGLCVALPAAAQNAYHDTWANHNIACFGPRAGDGLSTLWEILTDEVTNSQQVYNVSSFWNDNHGRQTGDRRYCDVQERRWTANRDEACRAGVWGCENVGFFGWIQTERWIVPVEVIAFPRQTVGGTVRGDQLAVRPSRVYDRGTWQLNDQCLSEQLTSTIDGVRVHGFQASGLGKLFCGTGERALLPR